MIDVDEQEVKERKGLVYRDSAHQSRLLVTGSLPTLSL